MKEKSKGREAKLALHERVCLRQAQTFLKDARPRKALSSVSSDPSFDMASVFSTPGLSLSALLPLPPEPFPFSS